MRLFLAVAAAATPRTAASARAALVLPIDVPGCKKDGDGQQSTHNPCAHVFSLLSRFRVPNTVMHLFSHHSAQRGNASGALVSYD